MSQKYDKPYLDKPKDQEDEDEQQKEELLYGDNPSLEEIKKKKEKYKEKQLNE